MFSGYVGQANQSIVELVIGSASWSCLQFSWQMLEGDGTLQGITDQEVEYRAPVMPGLARLRVTVTQRDTFSTAEVLITVSDSLAAAINPVTINTRGLPGYTFERAAGELWRCRFDAERNIIVVNRSE